MKSKTKQLATSVAEVQITLVQMVCALRIKTGCEDDNKCVDRTLQKLKLSEHSGMTFCT